jgi:hypothetical protein
VEETAVRVRPMLQREMTTAKDPRLFIASKERQL